MNYLKAIFLLTGIVQAQISVSHSEFLRGAIRATIKNTSNNTLIFRSSSLQILSPGVEGEWHAKLDIDVDRYNRSICFFEGLKSNYSKVNLISNDSLTMRSQDSASLMVNGFEDCSVLWMCPVDSSASPPDTLFKLNTAKDVDTLDARLGLYWQDSASNHADSIFIDCQIQFNRQVKWIVGISMQRGRQQGTAPIPTPNGWRVATDAHWILVDAQGHAIPLRRETTADGLFLRTTTSQRGVGYLRDGTGKSYRVLMGM